jgi:hypothetical protein
VSFSLVQQASSFAYPTTGEPSVTLGSQVTAGNLLIAMMACITNNGLVTDGVNLWIPLFAGTNGNGGGYGRLYAWYAIARRTMTLTVSAFGGMPSGGDVRHVLAFPALQVVEFSGASLNPLDALGTFATGTGTAPAGSVTAPTAGDLVLGIGINASAANLTPAAGWTSVQPGQSNAMIYAIEGSSGTFTPTFAQAPSGTWGVSAVAFKVAYTGKAISGNVGVAGVQVLAVSTTTTHMFTTLSTSGGAYSFSNMPNDTYLVQPQKVGQLFSPASSSVTVNGSDVTGQNFTNTAINQYLNMKTIFIDTFQRADENPLNPSNWVVDGPGIPPNDPPLAIVSNVCTFGDATIYANLSGPFSGGSMEAYAGQAFGSSDMFATVKVVALNSAAGSYAGVNIAIRAVWTSGGGPVDSLAQVGLINNGDGTVMVVAQTVSQSNTGVPVGAGNYIPNNPCPWGIRGNPPPATPGFIVIPNLPFTLGDTFGLAAIGSTYFILHNGVTIANYTDTTTLSGDGTNRKTGITIQGQQVSDVKVTNFVTGTVTHGEAPGGAGGFGFGFKFKY